MKSNRNTFFLCCRALVLDQGSYLGLNYFTHHQKHLLLPILYTQPFPLSRATRKVCLLSPLLFALIVELIISIKLKSLLSVYGINKWGDKHKVSKKVKVTQIIYYCTSDPVSCSILFCLFQCLPVFHPKSFVNKIHIYIDENKWPTFLFLKLLFVCSIFSHVPKIFAQYCICIYL